MSHSTWSVLAESSSETFYRFGRLAAMTEWWHWLLMALACGGIIAYTALMYRLDGADLKRGTKWSLVLLRILALIGVLFFFLDLEKRTENREVKRSRAVVLIDTSQSMGLKDTDPGSQTANATRIDPIIAEFERGSLFTRLRDRHDVIVYRFDQQTEPHEVAYFACLKEETESQHARIDQGPQFKDTVRQVQTNAVIATTVILGALLGSLLALLLQWYSTHKEFASWLSFVMLIVFIGGIIGLAFSHLQVPQLSWQQIAGLAPIETVETEVEEPTDGDAAESQALDPIDVAWQRELMPRGAETRIGDAIQAIVTREQGGPIAGVILLSDGRSNAGIDGMTAAINAESHQIPIYTIGLGSDRQPVNVRLVDLEAPKRVFPGDKFVITGYVQAYGLEDQQVSLELGMAESQGNANPEPDASFVLEDEQTIRIPADGEILPVRFEVSPNETGMYLYELKVIAPEQDVEKRDDRRIARVKVVDRKTNVLLLAGGPTREFRFLRNQLFRDEDTTVAILLQSSSVGISQEADQVLTEFPILADDLFKYDCILAFDPDWLKLDIEQLRTLDRWVAEQAGGLITVAGPIFTPDWAGLRRGRDPRADAIRALYPVVFYSQGSANLSLGKFGGDSAWPLDFTIDGRNAEFLRLEDDPVESEAAWSSFDGVYGYYSVKDPKPGARVFARFSNPETSIDGELPIYAAGHLYGAGRVYFQASGEMWRLRAVDERFFETYYTKLIRWASQGRLLRDSSRGVFLVDKDRCLLGDQVTARAVLNDSQHRPLLLDEVPAIILTPEGERQPILLRKIKNDAREGVYQIQFTALLPGEYRLELTPPGSVNGELLTAEVQVRVPALEIENPRRNDPLMKNLAETTGGQYFIGMGAAMNGQNASGTTLPSVIEPNDQTVFLPASIDAVFDQRLMGWLIILISGLLSMEWLFRRLNKLA